MKCLYMSRATARVVLTQVNASQQPDLCNDVFWGDLEILFDDRMPLGEIRLEDKP